MNRNSIRSIFISLFLLISCFINVGSSSFVINEESKKDGISINDGSEAVCYIGETKYTSIDKALNVASINSGKDTIYVIPSTKPNGCTIATMTSSHTLKNGDSLILPYVDTTFKSSSFSGSSVIDTNSDKVKANRKSVINFRNGADLTIENGASVIIGGITNTAGVTGSYCEINLGLGSSIMCYGAMEVYGYIKEDNESTITSNNDLYLIDNSCDSERFVHFYDGSSLKTNISISDAKSGGNMTSLNEVGVCPTNEFNIETLQTFVTFDYGSTAVALARMTAANTEKEVECGFVRNKGSSNPSIFYLESGSSFSYEYIPNNPLYTNPSVNKDYSKYIMNGNISLGYLYLDVTVTTIDTRLYFFPLSYKIKFFINAGSIFTSQYKIKLYPGNVFCISSGAEFAMNSDLIIYEKSDLSGNGITLFSYPISNIEDDALFIVNGKFTLSSSGHVGGKIKHTNNGGSTVDFSSCSDANLSVSSIEGGNAKEIVKQSIALFKVNSNYKEILIGSSQIITSSYENNNYYWNGKFNLTIQISIVLSVSYTYNVYFYTIYTADDSSGTNKSAISAIDSKDIKTYDVNCEKYIQFNTNTDRTYNIQVDFGDGNVVDIDQTQWYLSSGENIIVYITPYEGINLTIQTVGNSGAGHVEYTIYESLTKGGTYSEIDSTNNGSITTYVIKNRYFKFTTYSKYGYYFTTKPVKKDGTNIGVHGTENVRVYPIIGRWDDTKSGNKIEYLADGNYLFNFGWKS